MSEEFIRRRYIPKEGGSGWHVRDEEVNPSDLPTEYSGWTLPTLALPWGNVAKMSIWFLGMVVATSAAWVVIGHATAGIINQFDGHHAWTITIGN